MIRGLAPGVWAHVIEVDGFPTLSAVVLTSRLALVVDTLSGPAEVAPVADFVTSEAGGRRVVVVNTHHHWDHVFGNSAFAGSDIVAQRACPGLIEAECRCAGDASRPLPSARVPLPNVVFGDRLSYSGGAGEWVRTLRRLKRLCADLVVPAHGSVMDAGLIDANESYITGVYEAVADAKAAGIRRDGLDLPARRFLAGGVLLDDVYAAVHRENLLWAWDEV